MSMKKSEKRIEPVTWDNEPLYCRETVSESQHLFSPEAFQQMTGQTAMDTDEIATTDGGDPVSLPAPREER
jgi:hypothetical protein